MIKRVLTGMVLTFLFVFALSELVVPYIVSKQIEAGLAKTYGTQDIQVTATNRPAFMMLGGKFATVIIKGQNIRTDKLTISEFSAVFKNTTIDLKSLLGDRIVVFRQVGSFDGTVVLEQQEINQFMTQAVKGFKNVNVQLLPDKMKVSGDWAIGPANVAITMDGKLRGDQTQLKYAADQVFVNSAVVTGNFGGRMFTEFVLFDTKKLPVAAVIRDVITEQGRVIIRLVK